jgi:hypothetical protein
MIHPIEPGKPEDQSIKDQRTLQRIENFLLKNEKVDDLNKGSEAKEFSKIKRRVVRSTRSNNFETRSFEGIETYLDAAKLQEAKKARRIFAGRNLKSSAKQRGYGNIFLINLEDEKKIFAFQVREKEISLLDDHSLRKFMHEGYNVFVFELDHDIFGFYPEKSRKIGSKLNRKIIDHAVVSQAENFTKGMILQLSNTTKAVESFKETDIFGLLMADYKPDEKSAPAVASGIFKFVIGMYQLYIRESGEIPQVLKDFYELIGKGIKRGFKEALEILGRDLPAEIQNLINYTHKLISDGLEVWYQRKSRELGAVHFESISSYTSKQQKLDVISGTEILNENFNLLQKVNNNLHRIRGLTVQRINKKLDQKELEKRISRLLEGLESLSRDFGTKDFIVNIDDKEPIFYININVHPSSLLDLRDDPKSMLQRSLSNPERFLEKVDIGIKRITMHSIATRSLAELLKDAGEIIKGEEAKSKIQQRLQNRIHIIERLISNSGISKNYKDILQNSLNVLSKGLEKISRL